jgi:hypothetical protein
VTVAPSGTELSLTTLEDAQAAENSTKRWPKTFKNIDSSEELFKLPPQILPSGLSPHNEENYSDGSKA